MNRRDIGTIPCPRKSKACCGTAAWFAVRYDNDTFAIFDAFDSEAGREAHLTGQVAAALMARADELLAAAPQIRKANVIADKLPS